MSELRPSGSVLPAALAAAALAGESSAGFVSFTDEAAWMAATPTFTTINFTEVPLYTPVTDQYAPLGVMFTPGDDFAEYIPGVYPTDGVGLSGGFTLQGFVLPIIMEFAAPITSLAIRYPGITKFEMYLDGVLVASTPQFFGFDPWSFAGVVSDTPFDKLVITNTSAVANSMDTLYFGAPIPAPAAVGVLSLAGLLGGSRRRRG